MAVSSVPGTASEPGLPRVPRFSLLHLSHSRYLFVFILVTHCLASVAVWLSRLGPLCCLALDLAVLFSAVRALRQHWYIGQQVVHYRSGEWWLERGGRSLRVSLCRPVLLWPWLLVLCFRYPHRWGGVLSLVLVADNTRANEVRRLRVLLRTGVRP